MLRWSSACIVMAMLISGVPLFACSSIGIETDEGALVERGSSTFLQRADPSEVASFGSSIHPPMRDGRIAIDGEAMAGAKKDIRSDMFTSAFTGAHYTTRGIYGKTTDDMWNGSYMEKEDNVSGDLFYPEFDPAGTKGDYIDWYKMKLENIDPSYPGNSKNVTIELAEFTCNGTELYELTFTESEFTTDYLDFLELYIIYKDPMWGPCELGGRKFWYDDGNDTDGWVYDLNENWTVSFRSVGNSSGYQDPNGPVGGLTESGWYYIGISFNYYSTPNAVPRPDFKIEYGLSISTKEESNNFPSSIYRKDGAPNDMANASLDLPKKGGRTHSGLNYFDWYRVEGSDPNKDWNLSLWVNVTRTGWPIEQDFGVTVNDNWMHIVLVWWGEGDDGVFGTEDDGWRTDVRIFYYLICNLDQKGDPVKYMQERVTQSGRNNMFMHIYHMNDRTDTPQDPDPLLVGKSPRTVFIGLYSEPKEFRQTQTGGLIELSPDYQVFDEYTIQTSIEETKPNRAPSLSSLMVEKEDPDGVNIPDPYTGNLDSRFTLRVTYTDENDDPPEHLWIEFDPYTSHLQNFDLMEDPPITHKRFSEGVEFTFEIDADVLGTDPLPHNVHLWAMEERPSGAPGRPQRSNDIWFNDTIRVVDDEPVYVNEDFQSFYKMAEDSDTMGIPLEGFDGMFGDPEFWMIGYLFSNSSTGPWSESLELDFANITAGPFEGKHCAVVELKQNKHGNAHVFVKCYDAISDAISAFDLKVTEVNDPPMVRGIEVGRTLYPVDNYDPKNPVMRKFPEDLFEDREYCFRIIALDMDNETDATPLKYEYSAFDDWEVRPIVQKATGWVTLKPTNSDSRSDSLDLTITVSDGDGAFVILRMTFEVLNVNDPPLISLSNDIKDSYVQGQMMKVKVSGSDMDRGDALVFDVNMESMVGTVVTVSNQITEADLLRGMDWDINPTTGDFWFELSDQDIWSMPDGTMVPQVLLDLEFSATDQKGAKSTQWISVYLIDRNYPPPPPDMINYEIPDTDPLKEGTQGLGVDLWIRPVLDPDGDLVTYRWSFSDGGSAEGIRVHHEFAHKGEKVIQVYASDGDISSNLTRLSITLVEPNVEVIVGPIDDEEGSRHLLLPIIVFILTLVVIGAISAVLIYIFVLPGRKMKGLKKAPAPPTEFISEDR